MTVFDFLKLTPSTLGHRLINHPLYILKNNENIVSLTLYIIAKGK